jgi:hypothetical protein
MAFIAVGGETEFKLRFAGTSRQRGSGESGEQKDAAVHDRDLRGKKITSCDLVLERGCLSGTHRQEPKARRGVSTGGLTHPARPVIVATTGLCE